MADAAPTRRGVSGADDHRSPWLAGVAALMIVVALLLPWLSAADHALYPPDEGRYATVSRTMAEGGSWLIPTRDGHPHLTKPPLTYWLQAAAIKALGPSNLAPRLPSLLAGTLTLGLLLLLAWRLYGLRVGVIAAAILAALPLHLTVSRLAITDALLATCWLATLAGGLLRVTDGRRRWLLLLWLGVGAGLLVKGPVALIPLVVLVTWLAMAGQFRRVLLLRPMLGLLLAASGALTWVVLVLLLHPDAVSLWRHELVDRAVGQGDHPEPIWFFLPVLLVGCFPATAMLTLPGFNCTWRGAWRFLRSGSPEALLTLAVLVPLVILSLSRGKLPTYALPMAAPLALLAALAVERWLKDDLPKVGTLRRVPDIRWTLAIILALATPGAVVAAFWFVPEAGLLPLWLVLPMLAAWTAVVLWPLGPRWRAASLVGVSLAWTIACFAGVEIEDVVRSRTEPRQVIELAAREGGGLGAHLQLLWLRDDTLSYYASAREVSMWADPLDPERHLASGDRDVVVVGEAQWNAYALEHPQAAARFKAVGDATLWPRRKVLLLKAYERIEEAPKSAPGGDGSPIQ